MDTIWTIINYIGSAGVLILLYMMTALIFKAKRIPRKVLGGCIIMSVILFIILFR